MENNKFLCYSHFSISYVSAYSLNPQKGKEVFFSELVNAFQVAKSNFVNLSIWKTAYKKVGARMTSNW